MTLSWSTPQNQTAFTTQTLLVDSDSTGLQTLTLDGAARTVTLSSDNINVQFGTSVNYSFRLVGTLNNEAGEKIKSENLQEQHFFELQAPNVTMVGVPDGIKLTFNDELFGLDNYGATQVMPLNEVTGVEVSLSYVDPEFGPDLDSYTADAQQITGGNNDGTGKVLFVSDPGAAQAGNNTVGELGVPLVNGRPYEVSVRYITSELGFSPATLDQTVIPSDKFSEPQNVSASRPSGADAENNSIAVSFNGPSNDINPNGSNDTFVGHYELWYKKSATNPGDVTDNDLDNNSNPTGWSNVTAKNLTPAAGSGAALDSAFTIIQDGLESGKLYWFIVRAVRDSVGGEANGEIKGAFSSPVDGLVFNYVDVAAPIITGNTTQGSQTVTVKSEYPTAQTMGADDKVAATIFAQADVGNSLSQLDYSSKFVVIYADNSTGTNNATTVEFDANALSATAITDTIDFGNLGVRKFITSATYVQTYKSVEITNAVIDTTAQLNSTSANANDTNANRIFTHTHQPLTTFSAPSVPTNLSSVTYNNIYEPLSTGKDEQQGELKVTWDALDAASAFVDGVGTTANTHFFGDILYRVLVTGTGAGNVSGNEDLAGTTAYLSGLNIDVNYTVKVQAYFVNPENAILSGATEASTSQEVTGGASTGVTDGTTPFYWPGPVIANSSSPSVSGTQLTFSWNAPAQLNGVGSAGSGVTLKYRYVLTVNSGIPAAEQWVAETSADVTNGFLQGSGYHLAVNSGYLVDGVLQGENVVHKYAGTGLEIGTPHDIYYAEVVPPAISLSTSANNDPTNGVITATYADGGNNAALAFVQVNSSISPANGTAGAISGSPPTQDFSGLTNGTQHVVTANVVHSFGGQNWTSGDSQTAADDEDGIPFGKPIISDTTPATITGQKVTVTVNPNGRFLRETLFVGVPTAFSESDIGVFATNGNTALQGSANNATSVSVESDSFGYDLQQGLAVVENKAGSAVKLI